MTESRDVLKCLGHGESPYRDRLANGRGGPRRAAEGTSISDDRDGVARMVARDPGALLLAEQDGGLAGTVIAGFDGRRCHLYRLAVRPDLRRRGIGTVLPAAAEERFTALGGRRGDAMVLTGNERAPHAWRAAGYAPEDHWRRWVKPLTARTDRPSRLLCSSFTLGGALGPP